MASITLNPKTKKYDVQFRVKDAMGNCKKSTKRGFKRKSDAKKWLNEYELKKSESLLSIPWWRSHPIHENRATESICTEPCNSLLRATKSMKRATSTY